MKIVSRFMLLFVALAMIVGIMVPVWATEDSDASAVQGCMSLDAQNPLYTGDRLLESAEAVILYELNSGTLVYSYAPDTTVDPSGMNKLMTALLAVELGDPDAQVSVTRQALNSVAIGAVSAGLKVEEILPLRDLLYLMMVGSANDAAAVIAEHIGGSQEGFVALMNQRAVELGCNNTTFQNPHGLEADGQFTTARDLAKITAAALENELFAELFSAVEYTVPATEKSEERRVVTTNYLMSQETVRNQYDERVTGGKTGALSTTNRSLIATAESGECKYLSVVMNAKGKVTSNGLSVVRFGSFEETRALLDHAFSTYSIRQVLDDAVAMEQFAVSGGENDVVVRPEQALSAALPLELNPLDITYKCYSAESIAAPLSAGQSVGTVEVWYQSVCVGKCDLVAMYGVAEPGINSFMLAPTAQEERAITLRNILQIGGIVLLALIVVIAVAMLTFRLMKARRDKRAGEWVKPGKRGF